MVSNSLCPGDDIMETWVFLITDSGNGSLFDNTQPLSESMLTYCHLKP